MSRVLLVGKGTPERGGIPSFLDLLLHSRLAEEHELHFLNLAGGTLRGGQVSGTNLARTARDTFRVWRGARGMDVVHVHSALAPAVTMGRAGLLAAAARLRGARVIVHAHGGRVQLWLTTDRRRCLSRVLLAAAKEVVAVSVGGRDALARARHGVTLIENGVDLRTFHLPNHLGSRPGPPCILYVGLLSERKGVLDLLAASDRLSERGVDHRLVLVGGTPDEGEEAGALVQRAAESRTDRVVLAGTKTHDEMPHTYHEADVFCLPSWWEAMPLSVLEAMASGLPVVATDVGDVSRLLSGGGARPAGLVVPPRRPETLADALESLLSNPEMRAELGTTARARVEEAFDAARTLEAVGTLYRSSADSCR